MKTRLLMAMMLAVAGIALPAFATYMPPEASWVPGDPGAETNLYEIYNILYSPSVPVTNADLDGLRVGWELFDPATIEGFESITLTAVWRNAWMEQNFGFYRDEDGNGSIEPTEYNYLFTIPGISAENPDSPDLRGRGITETWSPSQPIGFFDTPYWFTRNPDQKLKSAWAPLHSEAARNNYYNQYANEPPYNGGFLSDWPNMYSETHILILETPDPSVYLLAIEDLPYGHTSSHRDYNDLIVELRINQVVPEPASMSLLGLGLAGIIFRRLRRVV